MWTKLTLGGTIVSLLFFYGTGCTPDRFPNKDTNKNEALLSFNFTDCAPDENDQFDVNVVVNTLKIEKINGVDEITGTETISDLYYDNTSSKIAWGATTFSLEGIPIPAEGNFEINVIITQTNCDAVCCAFKCGSQAGGKPIWKGSTGSVTFQGNYIINMTIANCKCC